MYYVHTFKKRGDRCNLSPPLNLLSLPLKICCLSVTSLVLIYTCGCLTLYNFYFPFTDAENSELDQLLGELLSLGQDLASVDAEPVADTSSWESRTEGRVGGSQLVQA